MAGPIRLEREREIYAREKIRSPTYAQQEAEDEYKRRVDREIARSKKGDSAFGLRSQHGDWRGRAEQRMTSIEVRHAPPVVCTPARAISWLSKSSSLPFREGQEATLPRRAGTYPSASTC